MLLTGASVVSLTHAGMRTLLVSIAESGQSLLDGDGLARRCASLDLPWPPSRDFLLAQGVLQSIGDPHARFSQLVIVSEEKEWALALANHQQALAVQAIGPSDLDTVSVNASHSLWMLLMNRYDETQIRQFHDALRPQQGAMGLVAYFRLRTLCVSAVYSPEHGTPCHFCHMGWESRGKATGGGAHSSIATLLRVFEQQGERTLPAMPLRPLDGSVACAFLGHLIDQLSGLSRQRLLQDEVTLRRELDLDTFSVSTHVAAHWPGCECQAIARGAS